MKWLKNSESWECLKWNYSKLASTNYSLCNNQIREGILEDFLLTFSRDPRIVTARTFWSTSSWNFTEFSDVDLLLTIKQSELELFKRDIISHLTWNRFYLWHWEYSSNHFYIVHDNLIPLDLYIVGNEESSVILRKAETRDAIFHILWLEAGITDLPLDPEKNLIADHNEWISLAELNSWNIHFEHFKKALTRWFRLLSKLEKNELIEFVYILNSIREDDLIPLFYMLGIKYLNAKKVKLSELPDEIRGSFVLTFSKPTRQDCYSALVSLIEILEFLLGSILKEAEISNTDKAKMIYWLDFSRDKINRFKYE